MHSDDCPKGESCNSVSPDRCNIIDLLQNADREVVPTSVPSRAPVFAGDPSNTKFVSEIFAHIREGRKKKYRDCDGWDEVVLCFVFSVSSDIQRVIYLSAPLLFR